MFALFSRRRFSREWLVAVMLAILTGCLSPASAQLTQPAPAQISPAKPAPPAPDKRYQPPKPLKHPTPPYPELPHLNRTAGIVQVRFSLDETGHVTGTVVSKSSGSVLLDTAVVRDPMLKDWTFEPATLDGKPVPSTMEKEFEYRLDPVEERALAVQRLALPVGMPQPPYPARAEALKAQGTCTIGIFWTERGLVDLIYLDKTSGSRLLDNTALRYVYTHWRIDPKDAPPVDKDGKQPPTLKTVTFTPPSGGSAPPSDKL